MKKVRKYILSQDRIKTVQEVLGAIDAWHQKNPAKAKRLVREKSVSLIRKMRGSRWSSSIKRLKGFRMFMN